MRVKNLFFFGATLVCLALQAQPQAHTFSVHFNSDEHTLDAQDKAILEEWVWSMKSKGYHEWVLKAHTDADAGNRYNLELSKKRAAAVREHLLSLGVEPTAVAQYAFGESKPLEQNHDAKAKAANRRVEIEVNTYNLRNLQDLAGTIAPTPVQRFTVDAAKPSTIVAANGTEILLPPNGFIDKDGKPISGNITLEVKEMLSTQDAIGNYLSTLSEGRILETGGMFEIQAKQNGKELKLKKGSKAVVNLPANYQKKDMQVFAPVRGNNGATEWKLTESAFTLRNKKAVPPPAVKIDPKQLQAMEASIPNIPLVLPNLQFTLSPAPTKPIAPPIPRKAAYAQNTQLFNWWERVLLLPYMKEARINANREKVDQINREKQEAYQARLTEYNEALTKYVQDSAQYVMQTKVQFTAWADQRNCELQELNSILEKRAFNNGLNKFGNLSAAGQLTQLNLRFVFNNQVKLNPSEKLLAYKISIALNLLKEYEKNIDKQLLEAIDVKLASLDLTPDFNAKSLAITHALTNNYAWEQSSLEAPFGQLLNNAESTLIALREQAGLMNKKDVEMVYTASLANFGMYNCDRFNETPPTMMVKLDVPYKGEARVSFFVKDINAFVYAYHDKNGYYVNLPKDKEVILTLFAIDLNGTPLFYQASLNTGNADGKVAVNPQPKSIFDIRKQLAAL